MMARRQQHARKWGGVDGAGAAHRGPVAAGYAIDRRAPVPVLAEAVPVQSRYLQLAPGSVGSEILRVRCDQVAPTSLPRKDAAGTARAADRV